jgi:DNA polymerase-3 subunit epsilon
MRLLFDTETTGLFDYKADRKTLLAPRIVQLAAILVDDDYREVASISTLIKPEGYEIPKEMTDIHGITTEQATKCGIPMKTALSAFKALHRAADETIGHNVEFDQTLIEIETRINYGADFEWNWGQTFCTKKAMTEHCKLPGGFNGEYKWPNLKQAFVHATGEMFDGAHNAMNDIRATLRVYRWLKDGAKPPEGPDYGRFTREFQILLRRSRVKACACYFEPLADNPKNGRFITGGEEQMKKFLDMLLADATQAMSGQSPVQKPLIILPN